TRNCVKTFLKILENFCRGDASLIRPEKSELKWRNFAAKSLLLSPKVQVYGTKSSARGRVSFQIQVADAKRGDMPQLARGMLATTVTLWRSSSTGPKLHRSSRAKISCQPERLWRARRAISRDLLRRSNTDKDAPGLSLSLARQNL